MATGRTNQPQAEDVDETTSGSCVFLVLPSAMLQLILRIINSDKQFLDESEYDMRNYANFDMEMTDFFFILSQVVLTRVVGVLGLVSHN